MRLAVAFCLLGFVFSACAEDVTVQSWYDEVSGKWIGDIHALTNELQKSTSSRTVYLSAGEYDVTELTNAFMYSETYFGKALLRSRKARIKSLSGKPEDVIIKAKASARILALEGEGELHGVTVTGGNASGTYISYSNHKVAGGVLLLADSSIVSNCVFCGNKASANGGAVGAPYGYFKGKVYNSVFHSNNESSGASLVAVNTRLYNCVVTNNVSIGLDTQTTEMYVIRNCHVFDSYIAHNAALYGGGVVGGMAVGCDFINNRQYNTFNKYHWSASGGGAARNAALTNCYFYGNVARRLGGAVRGGNLYQCQIVSNRTTYADSQESVGGGVYAASLVEDCMVASNYTYAIGGGLGECTRVVNCDIVFNRSRKGGGAANSALENCNVRGNVASMLDDEIGAGGGGVYGGSAVKCTIKDNTSSTYDCDLVKECDISGSRIHAKVVDSCIIHGVDNGPSYKAVGNVSYPGGMLCSNMFMLVIRDLMRNCLVTNCNWRSLGGSFVNPSMFTPYGTVATRVENCTFADNGYYLLGRFFRKNGPATLSGDCPIAFVNCAFVGNKAYLGAASAKDIETFDCSQLVFSNCLYGVVKSLTPREEGFVDSGCVELGATGNPGFVTWEDQPRYSPKRISPLRGAGLLLDWMGETAVDLSGRPRVRDGKVDVGCYQCWLDPLGFSLRVR